MRQFTIIDRDNGERFSTRIFESRNSAEQERNRLALKYGEVSLGIGQVCESALDKDVTDDHKMQRHKDSHLDHGLSEPVIEYLLTTFADRSAFFTATIELPPELGTVPCGLFGPLMGDPPVTDAFYGRRNGRPYDSRLVRRPKRDVRTVTVIAGPHDGLPCVLFTAFGGPMAPREPGDPALAPEQIPVSKAFWDDHALAVED